MHRLEQMELDVDITQEVEMNIFEYLIHRSTFEDLVRNMNIPEEKKQGTVENLRWFDKYGYKKNRFHENYQRAVDLAQTMLNATV